MTVSHTLLPPIYKYEQTAANFNIDNVLLTSLTQRTLEALRRNCATNKKISNILTWYYVSKIILQTA